MREPRRGALVPHDPRHVPAGVRERATVALIVPAQRARPRPARRPCVPQGERGAPGLRVEVCVDHQTPALVAHELPVVAPTVHVAAAEDSSTGAKARLDGADREREGDGDALRAGFALDRVEGVLGGDAGHPHRDADDGGENEGDQNGFSRAIPVTS